MKNTSAGLLQTVLLSAAVLLTPSLGYAQSNQIFDGGTGTWDAGVTPDWDGGIVWTNGNIANFNSDSTVTVSGTVVEPQINFNGGSTTISGGTIDQTIPSGYTGVTVNSGPDTISSQIELGSSGPDTQYFLTINNGSSLTIGNIDFGLSTANGRLQANANGGSSITFSGTYTTNGGGGGQLNFGAYTGTGTYTLAPTADFTHFNTGLGGAESGSFNMTGAVLNIETSKFDGNQSLSFHDPDTGNLVNIVGAQNISLSIYSDQKNGGTKNPSDPLDNVSTYGQMIFNQSTAAQSTWSNSTGYSSQNGGNTTLEAAAGGRLNWARNLDGSSPEGLTVNAATGGVVVLSSNGNSYNLTDGNGYLLPTSTVAATLKGGTTLITNTANSAFGTSSGVVNVEAGATLGGSGISAQQVIAVGGSSIIAPGDAGQANLGISASTATLTLAGGLQMGTDASQTGGTLAFALGGVANSFDQLVVGGLTLAGTIDVNLTNLGNLELGHVYQVISGSGTWDTQNANFVFTAPAGDAVTYSLSNSGHYLNIELEAVPEPSTYALMLGGLALLGFWQFRSRRSATSRIG